MEIGFFIFIFKFQIKLCMRESLEMFVFSVSANYILC